MAHEEARAQHLAKVHAKKQAQAQLPAAPQPAYRGAHAVHKSAGAKRAGFRQRTKMPTVGGGDELFQELKRLNTHDKLKGNTFGAKGSTRSGSKDTSRPDGLKTSLLPSANRKLKVDFGGL